MSYWNNRVVRTRVERQPSEGDSEFEFTIREVYYNDKGEINAISSSARPAYGDSVAELKESLERMLRACEKAVLIEEEIQYAPWDDCDEDGDDDTTERTHKVTGRAAPAAKVRWTDGLGLGAHQKGIEMTLEVKFDYVAEALDDLADLCEHWKRNRERGRMPNAIRSALLMSMREALEMHDADIQVARSSVLLSLAEELDVIEREQWNAASARAQVATVALGLRNLAKHGS